MVRLGGNVVISSPASRQFFFMDFPLTDNISFFFYNIYSGVVTDLVDSRELSGMGT